MIKVMTPCRTKLVLAKINLKKKKNEPPKKQFDRKSHQKNQKKQKQNKKKLHFPQFFFCSGFVFLFFRQTLYSLCCRAHKIKELEKKKTIQKSWLVGETMANPRQKDSHPKTQRLTLLEYIPSLPGPIRKVKKKPLRPKVDPKSIGCFQ